MILKPDDLSTSERYKILIGSVVPRPIAWVSSIDKEGNPNLAPFSYFTVGARSPMTLIFCPQVPVGSKPEKDTLHNIRLVPEFVINLTGEDTAQAMNLTATELPHGISEFEWAGITPVDSEFVRPPRVAESPIAFECKLQRIVTISEEPGGGVAIFGEVICIHLRDDVYVDGYVKLDVLKPIGRLAGSAYTKVSDVFEMARVPPPAK